MDKEHAQRVLEDSIDEKGLYNLGWYLAWRKGDHEATLDGSFTAEDLEAIAWVMRNGGL